MSTTPSDAMRPGPKSLVDFFSRSLTSFQSSADAFRVLCTLPHHSKAPAPRQPTSPERQLIVLDSSFNPPTTAHMGMVRSALRGAAGGHPSRVMLLLAVHNADKAPKPASFPIRLGMMEAFGREVLLQQDCGGRLEVDVAVTTMPYFHDKARAIAESGRCSHEHEGVSWQAEQAFLAGFDTLVRIFDPKYYGGDEDMRKALRPFLERARVRVTMRPDDQWGGVDEQRAWVREREEGGMGGFWKERVDVVEGVGKVVSSSKVREAVRSSRGEKKGELLDGLVPKEVREWIEREGLYVDDE